ncbi:hypothetical protein GIY62_09515 [Burkholderia plantarii]|uniref:hypothetical protein n=1 Tax=Burkholderia plantarii TaxID=41899 RepID=UPI00272CD8BE|nr:hypothetical protein [Burkholderia plantarii]WLE60857.1 hypothetical protein GIY62_09515 [Burkholderia plantarii]
MVEVASFDHDDAHRETLRELGNGLKQLTLYYVAGRLARQTRQGTSGKVVERRQHDQAGRLPQIADLRRGAIQYAYAPLHRLTRAQSTPGMETFAFDPASNLVEATGRDQYGIGTEGDRRTTPLLDNLPKQYAGTHLDYDERVNLTRRPRNGEFDPVRTGPVGWMTGAVNRHTRATYAYDALGRRIAKYTNAKVTPLAMAGSGWRDAERARLARGHGYGLTLCGWEGDRLAYGTMKARREIVHYVYEPDSFTPRAGMRVPMCRPEDRSSGNSANR